MSLFDSVPILPQQSAGVGERGTDGPAGAAGAPGPNGAPGASGTLTLVEVLLNNAQLHTLDVPTAIALTADQPGFLQVVVAAGFEINKTHLSGAGAVPTWQLRYRGTATVAFSIGVMDLGNTRNFGVATEQAAITSNSGAPGVVPVGAGLGLDMAWSATYAPSTFSGDARLWAIIASVALATP